MSYNNPTNGALPSIYSADLVEEMRKYNAGLTTIGAQKSRPRRGGTPSRSVYRGMGSGISPGRGGSTVSRSSNGAGYGMMGDYVVQPQASTFAPSSHLRSFAANARAPASTQQPGNRWSTATLSSNLQPSDNKSVPSAAVTTFPTSQQTKSSLERSISQLAVPTQATLATGHQENPHQHALMAPSNSSRSPIVTNWGPDPEGPFIPGHLKQSSAYVAIITMAQMIGKPLGEVTSNGVSIPASNPQTESEQTVVVSPNPVQTEAQSSGLSDHTGGFRANVDSNEWMAHRSAAKPTRQAFAQSILDMDMEMDLDVDVDVGVATPLIPSKPLGSVTNLQTFQNSDWGTSKWSLPAKQNIPYVATPAGVSNAHASATHPLKAFEGPRAVATLQDSQWAPASVGLPARTTSNTHHIQTASNKLSMAAPAQPQRVANLQSSQWATPSFGIPANAASSNSAQNRWSHNQPSASVAASSAMAPSRSISTASMAPVQTTAAPANNYVTSHNTKHEPGVKYLKDSMWA